MLPCTDRMSTWKCFMKDLKPSGMSLSINLAYKWLSKSSAWHPGGQTAGGKRNPLTRLPGSKVAHQTVLHNNVTFTEFELSDAHKWHHRCLDVSRVARRSGRIEPNCVLKRSSCRTWSSSRSCSCRWMGCGSRGLGRQQTHFAATRLTTPSTVSIATGSTLHWRRIPCGAQCALTNRNWFLQLSVLLSGYVCLPARKFADVCRVFQRAGEGQQMEREIKDWEADMFYSSFYKRKCLSLSSVSI